MNINILRRCVEELSKEKPDLSYIRGMLETIIELSTLPEKVQSPKADPSLDAKVKELLGNVPPPSDDPMINLERSKVSRLADIQKAIKYE